MKVTITSTNALVTIDKAKAIQARVWEGVTERGVPFVAYITYLQVKGSDQQAEFQRELAEHSPAPEASTLKAIDMRMIL